MAVISGGFPAAGASLPAIILSLVAAHRQSQNLPRHPRPSGRNISPTSGAKSEEVFNPAPCSRIMPMIYWSVNLRFTGPMLPTQRDSISPRPGLKGLGHLGMQ